MRTVGIFEAKQKLSELVERASRGERIRITRRGKVAAEIVPAGEQVDLKEVFARMDEIRKRSKKPKSVSIKKFDRGRKKMSQFVLDASVALAWVLDVPIPVMRLKYGANAFWQTRVGSCVVAPGDREWTCNGGTTARP